MNKPTQLDMIRHLSEHYGLPFTQVAAAMKVPTHPGTMRDDFAAFAMSSLLRDPEIDMGCDNIACMAYNYADAMLAERIKPK